MNARLKIANGEFVRSKSSFRNWITKDGSAGSSGEAGFAAEPDRYHLYISHACPWAHRTMIFYYFSIHSSSTHARGKLGV